MPTLVTLINNRPAGRPARHLKNRLADLAKHGRSENLALETANCVTRRLRCYNAKLPKCQFVFVLDEGHTLLSSSQAFSKSKKLKKIKMGIEKKNL